MKKLIALTALAAATALSTPALARTMTPEDLVRLKRMGAPTASPDGQYALFSLSEAKADMSGRVTGYYLLDLTVEGAEPVRLDLLDPLKPADAVFGGDGAIWFISGSSGSSQIWRMALDGVPEQVSELAGGDIGGFKLSADASHAVVWAERSLDCDDLACANVEPAEEIGNAMEFDEIFVRHWDEWETPGTTSRLFGFAIADGKLVGSGVPLDRGLSGDTPSKPFGGGEEISLTPDGKWVFFAQRENGRTEPTSTNLDIYASPTDGSAAPVNLTEANKATDNLPTVSPDGTMLAYGAMERPGYESDRMVLMVRDLATGDVRAMSAGLDRSVDSIVWAPDGSAIVIGYGDHMENPLAVVDMESGNRGLLVAEGHAGDAVPLEGSQMIFTRDDITQPKDLYRWREGKVERLTEVNKDLMAEFDPVTFEKFEFAGAHGDKVWGFRLKPADAEGKLPVAFVVHGGPQGSFNNSWSTRWNSRTLSQGRYAVVSIDFHGSTGYGQAFTDSINNDWGGKPLIDLKLGLDHALEMDAQLDGGRVCALGASYGGFMMNWIQGNWSDRFDCIVNHDGTFDQRSMYYTTEELWFPEWEFGGPYWAASANYERWNPANHVDQWKTPMLVIHGLQDFRVPDSQGLAAFTHLQRRGIPSKYLVFPTENHWVLNGANSVRWHNEVFEWLDRWIGKEKVPPPEPKVVKTPALGR